MSSTMSFLPLGSGKEVGRSCHLLEYLGSKVMFDCGIHPGYEGSDGLPDFKVRITSAGGFGLAN